MSNIYHMPAAHCPRCQNSLNSVDSMTDCGPPRPGDLTICLHCATVLEFTSEIGVQPAQNVPPIITALAERLRVFNFRMRALNN